MLPDPDHPAVIVVPGMEVRPVIRQVMQEHPAQDARSTEQDVRQVERRAQVGELAVLVEQVGMVHHQQGKADHRGQRHAARAFQVAAHAAAAGVAEHVEAHALVLGFLDKVPEEQCGKLRVGIVKDLGVLQHDRGNGRGHVFEGRRHGALHVIAQALLQALADALEQLLQPVHAYAVRHGQGIHGVVLAGVDAFLADELEGRLVHLGVLQLIQLAPCRVHHPALAVGHGHQDGVHPVGGPGVPVEPVPVNHVRRQGEVKIASYHLVIADGSIR